MLRVFTVDIFSAIPFSKSPVCPFWFFLNSVHALLFPFWGQRRLLNKQMATGREHSLVSSHMVQQIHLQETIELRQKGMWEATVKRVEGVGGALSWICCKTKQTNSTSTVPHAKHTMSHPTNHSDYLHGASAPFLFYVYTVPIARAVPCLLKTLFLVIPPKCSCWIGTATVSHSSVSLNAAWQSISSAINRIYSISLTGASECTWQLT